MSRRVMFGQAVSAAPSGSEVYDYSASGDQTFAVPAGVTEIGVKLWGGGGSSGPLAKTTNDGGGGGAVIAKIAVTPEEELTIKVGGGGNKHDPASSSQPVAAMYGGGLSPIPSGGSLPYNYLRVAGNGGGYSAIYRGETLLAMAGGGGGGGIRDYATLGPGAPGGEEGAALYWRGGGGTQSAGGAGGTGQSDRPNGANGSALQGGNGGQGIHGTYGSGAGGGGGYYGGGGGGVGSNSSTDTGGAGGGSNYVHPTDTSDATKYAGSTKTPGNASDADRGTAGNAGATNGSTYWVAGNPGRVVIEYGDEISW